MRKLLMSLALACAPCFALTTVSDTLYRADGTTCSGSMSITWQTFLGTDGRTIYAGTLPDVHVVAGVFTVALEPGQYAVAYNITPGCAPAYENWVVPTAAGTVNLAGVRSLNAPAPYTLISPIWIAQSGATVGQSMCWLPTGQWGPGACGGGGGSGTITVESSGTVVGSEAVLNFLPAGVTQTISDTGTAINIQTGVDTAVFPTMSVVQAGLGTIADTGASGTSYAGCPTPVINALTTGMWVVLIPAHTSAGGATTFNLCTIGARAMYGWGTAAPAAGDLVVGKPVILRYGAALNGGAGAWVFAPDGNAPSGGGGAPAPLFGAYATRPACASGNTGQTFNAAEISNKHWTCDGTTWQPVAFDMQVVEPTALTWSTIVGAGSNTPTITNIAGAVQLSGVASGGGYYFQGMLAPLSMTTPYTIEVAFTMDEMATAYSLCQWGVANGNSPSSWFLGPGWQVNSGSNAKYVFTGQFSAIAQAGRSQAAYHLAAQPVIRSKMVDDGTNRQWFFNTGSGWQLWFSESDMADVSPANYWGMGCTMYAAGEQFQLTLYQASVHH